MPKVVGIQRMVNLGSITVNIDVPADYAHREAMVEQCEELVRIFVNATKLHLGEDARVEGEFE